MPATPIILPPAFRSRLLIDTDQGPQPLASVLDPWQREDFERLDRGWQRVAGEPVEGYLRAWFERPRGHSKTGDIATMVCWALVASRRRLTGYCAAGDGDQAALLHDAVDKLCALNPNLRKLLDVQATQVINRQTGSRMEILTSDAPTSYGLLADFIVCDEISVWKKRDLWDSLFSSAAKRANCLLVVIGNAGYGDTWQWQLRESIRVDPLWLFSRLEGPRASWISPERLAEQRRLLPEIAYRRLWGNEWTSGTGDALADDLIEAAITLPGPIFAAVPGWQYVAGVDLGISRDASAITVVGRDAGRMVEQPRRERPVRPLWMRVADELDLRDAETGERYVQPEDDEPTATWIPGTGKVRLTNTRVFQPRGAQKVELSAVEAALVELHRIFRLAAVAVDPWQAQLLIERLQRAGIPAYPVPFVSENLRAMAQATLDAFNERQIEMYRDAELIADLKSLRVKETGNSFRLFSVRGEGGTAHSDVAQALSLGLVAAKRLEYSSAAAGPPYAGAPLISYP